MNTLLDPEFLGPFNRDYGYFIYDPETNEVTAIAFCNGFWDYSTWTITESGNS
jgi:hypothetical protein